MKRLLLLFAAVAVFGSAAAQPLSFGVKAGTNLASLAGVEGLTPRIGAVAGGVFEYRPLSFASLQVELLYSMQGARYNDGQGTGATYCYDYINMPILLKYYPFDMPLAILGGVQLGWLPDPKVRFVCDTSDGQAMSTTRFVRGEYNPFEFSAAAGVEYRFYGNFGVELRYTLGLLQIHYGVSNMQSGRRYISIPDNRNSVVQIAVNYRF